MRTTPRSPCSSFSVSAAEGLGADRIGNLDIKILGHQQRNGIVKYAIELNGPHGGSHVIYRRFSDFEKLHQDIFRERAEVAGAQSQPMPPKSFWRKHFSRKFQAARERSLEEVARSALVAAADADLDACPRALRSFLGLDDECDEFFLWSSPASTLLQTMTSKPSSTELLPSKDCKSSTLAPFDKHAPLHRTMLHYPVLDADPGLNDSRSSLQEGLHKAEAKVEVPATVSSSSGHTIAEPEPEALAQREMELSEKRLAEVEVSMKELLQKAQKKMDEKRDDELLVEEKCNYRSKKLQAGASRSDRIFFKGDTYPWPIDQNKRPEVVGRGSPVPEEVPEASSQDRTISKFHFYVSRAEENATDQNMGLEVSATDQYEMLRAEDVGGDGINSKVDCPPQTPQKKPVDQHEKLQMNAFSAEKSTSKVIAVHTCQKEDPEDPSKKLNWVSWHASSKDSATSHKCKEDDQKDPSKKLSWDSWDASSKDSATSYKFKTEDPKDLTENLSWVSRDASSKDKDLATCNYDDCLLLAKGMLSSHYQNFRVKYERSDSAISDDGAEQHAEENLLKQGQEQIGILASEERMLVVFRVKDEHRDSAISEDGAEQHVKENLLKQSQERIDILASVCNAIARHSLEASPERVEDPPEEKGNKAMHECEDTTVESNSDEAKWLAIQHCDLTSASSLAEKISMLASVTKLRKATVMPVSNAAAVTKRKSRGVPANRHHETVVPRLQPGSVRSASSLASHATRARSRSGSPGVSYATRAGSRSVSPGVSYATRAGSRSASPGVSYATRARSRSVSPGEFTQVP